MRGLPTGCRSIYRLRQSSSTVSLTAILLTAALLFVSFPAKADELEDLQNQLEDTGASWWAERNELTDLDMDELQQYLGALPPEEEFMEDWEDWIEEDSWPEINAQAIPGTLDWRNHHGKNYITSVKNQGSCGSCWAFAAVGSSEAAYAVYNDQNNPTIDLAEQHLNSECCSAGDCGGGYPGSALSYIRDTGVPDEPCFPYQASNSSCSPCSDWQSRVTHIASRSYYYNRPETELMRALQMGPITATFEVFNDFYSYGGGVYEHTWGDSVGWHAIVIVGYNQAEQYWIAKNSWGSGWGESGYFRIRWNQCHIDYYNYQPLYSSTPLFGPDFSADDANTCIDDRQVSFTNLSGDMPTYYLWDFGDGDTSEDENPNHTFPSVIGSYTVTLTAWGPGGVDDEVKTNYISVQPLTTADFSASLESVCPEESLSFTNLSEGSNLSYDWNFGDGEHSNQVSPQHTYSNPGDYTVTLTVTGACGNDSAVKPDFIHVIDVAAECDDGNICTINSCSEGACSQQNLSTVCREANGACDAPEYCPGDGGQCPEDALEPASTECRAAAGDCDAAEYCPGDAVDCPADNLMPNTTECRSSAGDCDIAEFCPGDAVDCPANDFLPASAECRSSGGDCDVAETCTGSSADCPTNDFLPASSECRSSGGDCDPAETCTGSSADCPTNDFLPASAECRSAAGECDAVEFCTGSGANCPSDDFLPVSTECRTAAGDCDYAEYCPGDAVDCPADNLMPNTTECRSSAGDCDIAEFCTGDAVDCPANDFLPASAECRSSGGDCDVAETCTGSSADCPANDFLPASSECRSSGGDCDPAETCTGSSADCPTNDFLPASAECRSAAGECDAVEFCTGVSVACPTDDYFSASTECRAAAGDCDPAEFCPGDAVDCPADNLMPNTTECRSSAGDCDIAEFCPGDVVDCPANDFLPASAECRSSGGDCDVSEYCTGHTTDCPDDMFADDGSYCSNDWCHPVGECIEGECIAEQLDCSDDIPCTEDSCNEDSQICVNDEIPCAEILVTPECPTDPFNGEIEIPVTIDRVDGEDNIGFTLVFDADHLNYIGYSVTGTILEDWLNRFQCGLDESAGNRIQCTGDSDVGLFDVSISTLAVFLFETSAAKATEDKNQTVSFQLQSLVGDLQYMSAGDCEADIADDSADDDSADDDSADDDGADDDGADDDGADDDGADDDGADDDDNGYGGAAGRSPEEDDGGSCGF
jgi:PKD repeat protein/C1A family cysteine protease